MRIHFARWLVGALIILFSGSFGLSKKHSEDGCGIDAEFYERIYPAQGTLPTYRIAANDTYWYTHRFFDSSPFSPSGRYLALTRSLQQQGSAVNQGDVAEVVVFDLCKGKEILIAETSAWGSQLGSQLQWGATDEQLLFNVVEYRSKEGGSSEEMYAGKAVVRGMVYNIVKKENRTLDCGIYHVSKSGKYSVSPDLTRTQQTQLGYGVSIRKGRENDGPVSDDGIYLTDIETGKCRLLTTLKQVADAAGWSSYTPVYGFHTKWSPRETHIMFVVRTFGRLSLLPKTNGPIISPDSSRGWESFFGPMSAQKDVHKRRQHIFVVRADGSDLQRVLSWPAPCRDIWNHHQESAERERSPHDMEALCDGNHPNWAPGIYGKGDDDVNNLRFSMNLQPWPAFSSLRPARQASAPVPEAAMRSKFRMVVIDIPVNKTGNETNPDLRMLMPNLTLTDIGVGSGHPNCITSDAYHSLTTNKTNTLEATLYCIADAYEKERPWFESTKQSRLTKRRNYQLCDSCVPLRIVHAQTGKEKWLAQIPAATPSFDSNGFPFLGGVTKERAREITAWRCDLHPAYSRNGRWLAVNSRPTPKAKQEVLVMDLGKKLSQHLNHRR